MVDTSEEEIRKMEAEIKAKEIEAESAKTRQIEQLLDEAVSRGKDAAMEQLREQQEKDKAEAERQAMSARTAELEAELKRVQEASAKKLEELSKSIEEKIQNLEARPKGISKNESPFSSPSQINSIQGLSREELDTIQKNSKDAWFASQGRPAP